MEIKAINYLQNIDNDKQNCLWYGGDIVEFILEDNSKILVSAIGDVRLWLVDKETNEELVYVKDKNNGGQFYNAMFSYIKNDEELEQVINNKHDKYTMEFDNNNWRLVWFI